MPFARIREMKSLPFSVFKRANRPCYSVSFKNEKTGEYYPAISTLQKTEAKKEDHTSELVPLTRDEAIAAMKAG